VRDVLRRFQETDMSTELETRKPAIVHRRAENRFVPRDSDAPRRGGPPREGNDPDAGKDDPRARAKWFMKSRVAADGRPLRGVYLKASKRRHELIAKARGHRAGTVPGGTPGPSGSVNWTPLGPSGISSYIVSSGRVTCMAVGPGGSRL
jgi:hypothetical protein